MFEETAPQTIAQRTDEWHQQRLGKVTASRIVDLMATTRSGYSSSRANYMTNLLKGKQP